MTGIRQLHRSPRREPAEAGGKATTRRLLRAGLLLVVMAALTLPAQALAGAPAPFKGSDTGHFTLAQNACGPKSSWLRVDITGAGTAKQVGKYTYKATECFDGSLFYFGAFTMTTANGNKLVGTYSGTVGPTDDPNVASYDQDAEVRGGTGCYVSASGKFHVSGLANLATGDYSQKLSGVLSSSGSG